MVAYKNSIYIVNRRQTTSCLTSGVENRPWLPSGRLSIARNVKEGLPTEWQERKWEKFVIIYFVDTQIAASA